jgi:hypothetical protein
VNSELEDVLCALNDDVNGPESEIDIDMIGASLDLFHIVNSSKTIIRKDFENVNNVNEKFLKRIHN